MKSYCALKSFIRSNKEIFICCIVKILTDNHIQRSSGADDQISTECKMSLSVKFEGYLNIFSDEDTSILLKSS